MTHRPPGSDLGQQHIAQTARDLCSFIARPEPARYGIGFVFAGLTWPQGDQRGYVRENGFVEIDEPAILTLATLHNGQVLPIGVHKHLIVRQATAGHLVVALYAEIWYNIRKGGVHGEW